MDIEDSVDNAAHVASHPQRSQRGRIGDGAMVVRANVEEPFRFGHMAIAAGDFVLFADSAELPVRRRARLDGAGKAGLEEELLPEQGRGGRIPIFIGSIHRQARQWGKRLNNCPIQGRETVSAHGLAPE